MFEQWKEKEIAAVREQYGKVRLFTCAITAFMGLSALGSLVMLLDGGGAVELVAMAFQLAIMAAAWFMGDYKRRFIKPMLASVEEVLLTQGEREEFARQMGQAVRLDCPPTSPQVKPCPLWMGADYAYYRCPGKSRIWKNRGIRRIKLAKESYIAGRSHTRVCYRLSLFAEEEKPAWNGCFRTEEEAYRALETVRVHLPSNPEVDDQVACGKTEEGRREAYSTGLRDILMAALLVAVLYVVFRLISK